MIISIRSKLNTIKRKKLNGWNRWKRMPCNGLGLTVLELHCR